MSYRPCAPCSWHGSRWSLLGRRCLPALCPETESTRSTQPTSTGVCLWRLSHPHPAQTAPESTRAVLRGGCRPVNKNTSDDTAHLVVTSLATAKVMPPCPLQGAAVQYLPCSCCLCAPLRRLVSLGAAKCCDSDSLLPRASISSGLFHVARADACMMLSRHASLTYTWQVVKVVKVPPPGLPAGVDFNFQVPCPCC